MKGYCGVGNSKYYDLKQFVIIIVILSNVNRNVLIGINKSNVCKWFVSGCK